MGPCWKQKSELWEEHWKKEIVFTLSYSHFPHFSLFSLSLSFLCLCHSSFCPLGVTSSIVVLLYEEIYSHGFLHGFTHC
jgi:hypothetical protein